MRPQLGRRLFFPDFSNREACELIAPLVVPVAGMTLHPLPGYFVLQSRFFELSPEILIFYRRLRRRLPSALLPSRQPFGDPLAQVLGISEKLDGARLFQNHALLCLQRH